MVKGYCVKCRIKQDMSNITETTLKNNRPAFYGNCPVCKTKMFRIGSLADAKKKADDTAAPQRYGKMKRDKSGRFVKSKSKGGGKSTRKPKKKTSARNYRKKLMSKNG